MTARKLAVFCGGGDLPLEAARAARAAGNEPVCFALQGVTTADLSDFETVPLRMGEVGKLFTALKARGVGDMLLIGAITRPDWRDLRLDWGALKRADDLARVFAGGDDSVLKGVIGMIEREGVRVVGALDVAPSLAAAAGPLGKLRPTDPDMTEAKAGLALLDAISPFDVGQSCVVVGGRVVAVEGAEGTDAMLGRVADLRTSGRLRAKGSAGVFVKAPKRGQDLRVDLPSIGPKTVERAAAASLRGLAVAVGQVLVAQRAETIAAADAAGLFLLGVERAA